MEYDEEVDRQDKKEQNKNNVANYKKKTEHTSRVDELRGEEVTILTPTNAENKEPEPKTNPKPSNKSWSQIAGINVKKTTNVKQQQKKTIKIKPEFESNRIGYDRIVVTPTHFNNKPFRGYVTDQEANVINMAIGLHDMDNLHGTSFYRSENDVLFITYKLKQNMSIQEIE